MTFWDQDCPQRGVALSHAHWDKCTPQGGHPGSASPLIHFYDECCHCGARASEYRRTQASPPPPVVRQVAPDPQPTGELAEALRLRKKGHASQAILRGVPVIPHGPGGGFLLHSHVIHEDDPVEIKNAYADHIEQKHS